MAKKLKELKKEITKHPKVKIKIKIEESQWEETRSRALQEAMDEYPLDYPTPTVEMVAKKHGVPVEFIECQLAMGITVEHEHTSDPEKAKEIALDHLGELADYYTRLEAMMHQAGEEGALDEQVVHENVTERQAVSHKERMMPLKPLPFDKTTKLKKALMKTHNTTHAVMKNSTYGRKSMKEAYEDSSFFEDAPHPGFVMNYPTHTEHLYHGHEQAKKDRDAYARHLKSQGHRIKKSRLENQLLRGVHGHVYRVSYTPNRMMTEHVDPMGDVAKKYGYPFSHYSTSGADVYSHPNGNQIVIKDDCPSHGEWEYHGTHPERTAGVGSEALAHHLHSVHGHMTPLHEVYDIAFNENGPKKHTKEEAALAAISENGPSYKVGDVVIPKIGPHKGLKHSVIHVHDTGHVNIKPLTVFGNKNRYPLGAAKAHPNDLERYMKESQGYMNRKIVQEVFQKAKEKMAGEPQRELQGDNSVDEKDTDSAKEEKKSNIPVPEKKGSKVVIKGAGADDKFQPDPVASPLTSTSSQ